MALRRQKNILLIELGTFGYGRDVAAGVSRWFRYHPRPWTFHWAKHTELIKDLATMEYRPDGILCTVGPEDLARLRRIFRCPIVSVASGPVPEGVGCICTDDEAVGRLAAEHFIQKGFGAFGYLDLPGAAFSDLRQKGFLRAIGGAEMTLLSHTPGSRNDPRYRLVRLREFARRLPKPAAVFACNDGTAVLLLEALRGTGIRVPDQIALLGVDNDLLTCEMHTPSLSSIRQNADAIGYEAAALLDSMMTSRARPTVRMLPPAGIVERQSTDVLAITDPDLKAAVRFIRSHGHQAIGVPDILREVPVGRRWLEKRFRQELGRTILEEIHLARIAHVRKLLAETDMSIPEIARAASFSHENHLGTLFRQVVGEPPIAFRRRVRGARGEMIAYTPSR